MRSTNEVIFLSKLCFRLYNNITITFYPYIPTFYLYYWIDPKNICKMKRKISSNGFHCKVLNLLLFNLKSQIKIVRNSLECRIKFLIKYLGYKLNKLIFFGLQYPFERSLFAHRFFIAKLFLWLTTTFYWYCTNILLTSMPLYRHYKISKA